MTDDSWQEIGFLIFDQLWQMGLPLVDPVVVFRVLISFYSEDSAFKRIF